MESMVEQNLFSNIYKDKVVLVTGHTGFKGSWLVFWLLSLGAKGNWILTRSTNKTKSYRTFDFDMPSVTGDIRDKDKLNKTFKENKPDIVFHLAAQPLVEIFL